MPLKKRNIRNSREWLYLRLFEYMLHARNHLDSKPDFSKYELMTKVPNLPSQRQDRISEIVEKMIELNHLKIVYKAPNATYYNITKEGREWYNNLGRKFKKFSEMIRK